jgi:hypothetical protein
MAPYRKFKVQAVYKDNSQILTQERMLYIEFPIYNRSRSSLCLLFCTCYWFLKVIKKVYCQSLLLFVKLFQLRSNYWRIFPEVKRMLMEVTKRAWKPSIEGQIYTCIFQQRSWSIILNSILWCIKHKQMRQQTCS